MTGSGAAHHAQADALEIEAPPCRRSRLLARLATIARQSLERRVCLIMEDGRGLGRATRFRTMRPGFFRVLLKRSLCHAQPWTQILGYKRLRQTRQRSEARPDSYSRRDGSPGMFGRRILRLPVPGQPGTWVAAALQPGDSVRRQFVRSRR
jgi:hypothetical protein